MDPKHGLFPFPMKTTVKWVLGVYVCMYTRICIAILYSKYMANIIEIGSWAPHCPPLAAHPQNSQAGLYTINIDLERIHVILEYLQHGQFWMHGTKMGAILWFCADFGLLKPLSLQLPWWKQNDAFGCLRIKTERCLVPSDSTCRLVRRPW